MTVDDEEIPSPCNNSCVMDDDNICTGCFRSFVEILTWTKVDATTREFFMMNVEDRRQTDMAKQNTATGI
jgi:predicted Fe-S protein YdhL (DUF1289 family)